MKKKAERVATVAKPGRRPVEDDARDHLLQVRIRKALREDAEELAERYGMSLPDWVRARIGTDKAGV